MKRTLLAVFAVALAVRLAAALATGKGAGEVAGDAADYSAYAASLAERGTYEGPGGNRASRMPGYPLLLAAQYRALGRSPWATALWQGLLGALACVLVALLAARWSPQPWPLAAGLLAAVCWDLAEPCARVLTEAPTAFCLTLTLWLLSDDRALKARRAFLAGLAAAAAYLLRPEFLPWVFVAAAHAGWRSRWRCGAAVLAGPLLAAALWGARNAAVLGRPVVTTTAGSFNFYGWGIPRTLEERLGGPRWERAPEGSSELARSDFYAARARAFFLMEGKAGAIAKAAALDAAILYYPFSPALDPTFVFLAPLALLGAWSVRRDGRRRLLWLSFLYATAVYALAGVMIPRHRQPLMGLGVLLAAAGLEAARARLGRRRFAWAAGGWAAACAAAWAAGPFLRAAVLAVRGRLS